MKSIHVETQDLEDDAFPPRLTDSTLADIVINGEAVFSGDANDVAE